VCSACSQGNLWEDYRPRAGRRGVLYETLEEHWPRFEGAHEGRLPDFVRQEFDRYLVCGQLEHGFHQCECNECGLTHRVPFSCKGRGFCPSCLGRRMQDLSLHLVDRVLPDVSLRQWVLTVPWSLRARIGYDRAACSLLVRAFWNALKRSYRRRAKRELGLAAVADAQAGAITFVQRTDSALRLNPHLHTLTLDGVYVEERGQLVFRPLSPPTPDDLIAIARETAQALLAELAEADPSSDDDDLLHRQCLMAATEGRNLEDGRRPVRVIETRSDQHRAGSESVMVEGFGLHARVTVDALDRQRRLHLCRYLARPPMAQDRLTRRSDGKLLLRLKKPWRDGTAAVVLSPFDLIARLAAAVPPPRFHMLRYHGCLSAHAKVRADVVPDSPADNNGGPQLCLFTVGDLDEPRPKRARLSWAKLLARVFKIDVTVCPRCGGDMRIVRAITDPEEARRILSRLARPPPRAQLLIPGLA